MKQARQVIDELSTMKKPRFREGDRVRFGGGSIHGRYTGVIKRLFKNNKASVQAKVRGVDKVFHPDFDDMTLVTEDTDSQTGLGEARFSVGDRVKVDFGHKEFKDPFGGSHMKKIAREMIKRGGDGKVEIMKLEGDFAMVAGWKRDAILGTLRLPLDALKK